MSQISRQKSLISPAQLDSRHQSTAWLWALWKFSRPHTIIGTSLSVLALYVITLTFMPMPWHLAQIGWLLGAWITCLLGNVYIVGLNQLEDVEIDRINKPHLPLASGEFTRAQGLAIVATTGLLAFGLAGLQGGWLLATVGVSLAIGTAYSLPPLRLKRFPFWASLCIFSVRGVIVNLGLFLHYRQSLNAEPGIPLTIWALTLFILVFTFAIAIFKDIPDMDGDRQYNIRTLTIRLGAKAVFNLSRWVLTACYIGMIVAGLGNLPGTNSTFLVLTHGLLLGLMWWRSRRVNLDDKVAIASFYQFIWKLFFLEYLLFPIAALLH